MKLFNFNTNWNNTRHGAGSNPSVSSVSLDESAIYGAIGDTVQLVATVLPANATDKSVSWSSDDESVATVVNGLVTFLTRGTCTITVTTTDGSFTDTCAVTSFILDASGLGLTSLQVDAILAELATVNGLAYLATLETPTINISGNEYRTYLSGSDYDTLTAAGVDVVEDGREAAFMMIADTTKAGSAIDTFILSLYASAGVAYDFTVEDWGDGATETLSGTNKASISHTYASPGVYTIKIKENVAGGFSQIKFNNAGDKLKVMYVTNWGTGKWKNFNSAFKGCSNLIVTAPDVPDLSLCTDLSAAFWATNSFTGNIYWNTSTINTMSGIFYYCTIKKSFATWSIEQSPVLTNFNSARDINETGTTTNLDETLVSWRNQAELYDINGLTPTFNTAKYSAIGEAAYNYLVNTKGWTIPTGGLA